MGKPKKAESEAGSDVEEEGDGSPKFEVNDTVHCHLQGKMYKAKILKHTKGDDGHHYFVHYHGWNSRWDKWSAESELVADGKEANALQKKLQKEQAKVDEKKRGASEMEPDGENTGEPDNKKKKKKSTSNLTESTEDDSEQIVVKLPLPMTLKKLLVQDWEFISQGPCQLVPLPRTVTANAIMDDFIESKKEGNTTAAQLARFRELIDGLKLYFNRALPLILLYHQEREQYEALIAKYPDMQPLDMYGPEHLLRLFTKLPGLLGRTTLSASEVTQVQAKLGEFLKFLQKKAGEVFLTAYESAPTVMASLKTASSDDMDDNA